MIPPAPAAEPTAAFGHTKALGIAQPCWGHGRRQGGQSGHEVFILAYLVLYLHPLCKHAIKHVLFHYEKTVVVTGVL